MYNRFKVYKYINKLGIFIFPISLVLIIILKLTSIRFVYTQIDADNANKIILSISYSLVGAYFFYFIHDYIPSLAKKDIANQNVANKLQMINQLLSQIVINPYDLRNEDKKCENFVKDNSCISLKSKEKDINCSVWKIKEIAEELLASYLFVLNLEQIEFLNKLINSYCIKKPLSSKDWCVQDGIEYEIPNNQEEFIKSIYEVYVETQSGKLKNDNLLNKFLNKLNQLTHF